jgi:hypothetical protein
MPPPPPGRSQLSVENRPLPSSFSSLVMMFCCNCLKLVTILSLLSISAGLRYKYLAAGWQKSEKK